MLVGARNLCSSQAVHKASGSANVKDNVIEHIAQRYITPFVMVQKASGSDNVENKLSEHIA